jgi:hypothetical protein
MVISLLTKSMDEWGDDEQYIELFSSLVDHKGAQHFNILILDSYHDYSMRMIMNHILLLFIVDVYDGAQPSTVPVPAL